MKPWKLLEQAGVLSPLDVELSEALARVSKAQSTEALLAASLVSHEVQDGHVCLDLRRWAGRDLEGEDGSVVLRLPALEPWLEELQRSNLVSTDGGQSAARPLVLDGTERLYFARYFEHEEALAKRVRFFVDAQQAADRPLLDDLMERLFPERATQEPDLQKQAVLASRNRRFSMIVGGPGTGKTSTVVRLLAVLIQDTLDQGDLEPRILLAAPTGKAAQRLGEAIEKARASLPVSERVRDAIPSTASTVHRALGTLQGSTSRFRHHQDNPLECDILLLDEASMVDLALMRRLLDAVPDHARVILLGDPDQLVSVEAGGVLIDLCKSADDPRSPLHRCKSMLTRSYRYAQDSGIAALALAVHRQDYEACIDILRSQLPDVAYAPSPDDLKLTRALESEAKTHYRGLSDAKLENKLAALDAFRVLCAHRTGPASVTALTPFLSKSVSGKSRRPEDNYAGRPILITQNDYVSRLFNGDVGVLHRAERATGRASGRDEAGICAHFSVGPETVRSLSLARLPRHESVYAMTVHKSQGSEFERVAIVLPEKPSPILSRELLYTAITRAKRAVSIYASEASLRAAITQRTQRASGLLDRLLA